MRPCGQVRIALLAVLQAGIAGTFCELARQAQVPELRARQTLKELRRAGVVAAIRPAMPNSAFPQRSRAIYSQPAANDDDAPFDTLSFARQAWR